MSLLPRRFSGLSRNNSEPSTGNSGGSPSQEVFRLRKSGDVEGAYSLALTRLGAQDRDEWDIRAFGWCLVDLIKKGDAADPKRHRYAEQLESLKVPAGDDVLSKQRLFALSMVGEGSEDLKKARDLSKSGDHRAAVKAYGDLFSAGKLGADSHTNFGWDIYKATRQIMAAAGDDDMMPSAVAEVRQNLAAYMKLEIEKPSLLHSIVLQQALKLGSADHLKVMVFVRMWGLENLRPEDYVRDNGDDGKQYPALAERCMRHAGKEAVAGKQVDQMDFILPHVERAIVRFPDNIWLKFNLVKLLKELGSTDEALVKAIDFAKSKASEYWTWDLLGDLQTDQSLGTACYCKALSCSQDDNFVSGVRLKLARHLADAGYHPEAKGEIVHVIEFKQRMGHKVPAEVACLQGEAWFSSTTPVVPTQAFYSRFAAQADEILFSNVPWMEACTGERFFIDGQDKPKRKLYLKTQPLPTEVSLPESRYPMRNVHEGTPVLVKGEFDASTGHRFTLHAMKPREGGSLFDVLVPSVGVVDNVNLERKVFHCIASRDAHGTFPIADYGPNVKVGDSVDLKSAAFYSKHGKGVRIISATPSISEPSASIRKQFSEEVRVDKGMGFTDASIFIPTDLVAAHHVGNGDHVSGTAALNFNKKRNEWGWKAIIISTVTAGSGEEENYFA